MKFLIAIFLIFSLNLKIDNNPSNRSNGYARNYIVYDYNSNEVLEGKDYNSSYSVASISKIMTAILALESDHLFDVITVDEIIYEIEGSSLYLEVEDKITIIDLVYGLMLRSGNDAAMLIAKHIGGSVEKFVELMNQKALELKMVNTTFNNPSGLDIFDEGNISSCLDMAKLMAYSLNNELFKEIIATKSYKSQLKGSWYNKNKLLHSYENCIGGKTGYTKKARRTLVTASESNYQTLIVVTFDSSSDFLFHKNIYENYFNNYTYLVFLEKGKNFIDNYYIYSDKVVGLRIKGNITKGTKVYYLNPITNKLIIKFIDDQQIIILNEEFDIIYYLNK